MSLMLHSGATEVSLEQLEQIPTPLPTETWFPIPHTTLIQIVRQSMATMGLEVVGEQHGVTTDGQRYFGILLVQKKNEVKTNSDFGWMAGLRNSHNKSFPAGVLVGSNVFVCDNLSFSGEIRFSRRHTKYIMDQLPFLVNRAVGQLSAKWTAQDNRFSLYKETEIPDRDVNDLLIRSMENGVVGPTFLPDILKEYRNPRHPEFAEKRNVWRLMNAYTEILKEVSLFQLPKRTEALTGLLDSYAGLVQPEDRVIEVN